MRRLAALLLLAPSLALAAEAPVAAPADPPPAATPLGPDELVAMALAGNGLVREADARVAEWKARLAEVEAIFYPKLAGLGFVAPMYRLEGGPYETVRTDWSEWGPYVHLEAILAQPLYTFGRAAAGEEAAAERMRVEEARARQVRNAIALEVRRLYFLHLYARSLRPVLDSARKMLDSALEKAREDYDAGTGKVTNVDLQKLAYGSAELDRYRIVADSGERLALAALKHTVGLPAEAELALAHETLPEPELQELPELGVLFQVAATERPEWAQLRHGKAAALSLEEAERLADAPVLFAAGQFRGDWTPMRPNVKNPYHHDPYNSVSAGVALGVQFEIDPARSRARAAQAEALGAQVDALAAFAATGIPLEVRKAREDVAQAAAILARAGDGATAARKWMIFGGAAFASGTGEAKDVLEGLVAYVSARRTQYEALKDLHVARAYLLFAVGKARGEPVEP